MSPREFNTSEPIGYFITWTTYGTWLPGDERGWNRKDELEGLLPDLLFKEAATSKMKEASFKLSANDRRSVHKVISDHCIVRRWNLHALNVRSNHVHVVVTAAEHEPKNGGFSVQGVEHKETARRLPETKKVLD